MTWDDLLVLRRLVPVALLIVLWSWESWRPFFGQGSGRWWHALGNLGLAMANVLLVAFLFGAPIASMAVWTEQHGAGLLNLLNLDGPARWLVGLVLLDGWMYLWHRANHAVPLLWHFHRLHHSDQHMDVTTATRFHPAELIAAAGTRFLLIPLLGLDLWLLAVYETLLLAVTQMHHADIALGRCDRWLRWLIVTPDLHKVHHSQEPGEHERNFSVVLSVWDRVAGTLLVHPNLRALRFGLKDEVKERPRAAARGLAWVRYFRRHSTTA